VSDRITLGAAALPEPDRAWLAAVEALPGIGSVWQGGHVLPPSGTGEAITRLALMTAWTERVRVGSAVLVLPLYPPVLVAKQLADLDARSGGRVTVGVGVGGEFPAEFEALGVPLSERGPRTDEAMEILRTLWSSGDEPVSHHGKFFSFDDVRLRSVGGAPRPLPLVVSGRKPPAMRRAAHLGDGWMPYLVSPSAYARSVDTIRSAAEGERELSDFEWCLYLYCSIRPTTEAAEQDVRTFLGGAYGDKPPEMLDRIAPSGTPDEVAAKIQPYIDAGARHIVISPAAPTNTLEVVELAATEVLPQLEVRS
jgi:alkanesulfonate monooxygenase SsuD/methylene tetrahydromethanopterin reductase-like flavin-dependent oxidoreductase (luciferase family)